MTTNKKTVQFLIDLCRSNGVQRVVVSPGSRSAPLVIAFSAHEDIECVVLPDERVAGFFALGMAEKLREPVVLICTSGTAVLNLAPAVCESYYKGVPLLVITADRPTGAHLNGENQAINQSDIYRNFVAFSEDIEAEMELTENQHYLEDLVFKTFTELKKGNPRPVHWNVHLEEPLYDMVETNSIQESVLTPVKRQELISNSDELNELLDVWRSNKKKLILLGMRQADQWDVDAISALAKRNDCIVWAETTSNFPDKELVVENADLCISSLPENSVAEYATEIVLTFGKQIVSKKVKSFLKRHRPIHYDIAPGNDLARNWDMFGSLKRLKKPLDEKELLQHLLLEEVVDNDFQIRWHSLSKKVSEHFQTYLKGLSFCDMKVFEKLVQSFPESATIHYGNSSPVRYGNLFRHSSKLKIYSNRGTSGIDGCVSTAAGASYVEKGLNICITGDVSFFYDSNALWNDYLSENFRIIIINNGGGNIFRMIEGPQKVKQFERFFETSHSLSASYLASMYGLPYYICENKMELETELESFYGPQNGKAAILEIKTDGRLSAENFKDYFSLLKQQL